MKDPEAPLPETLPPSMDWSPRRIIFLGIVGAILALSPTAGVRLMNARVGEGGAAGRDAERLADLQTIVTRVQEIYTNEKTLPKTLDEIDAKSSDRLSVADPQTFEVYEYNVLEERLFEVCARFEEAATDVPDEHKAGRSCFQVRME